MKNNISAIVPIFNEEKYLQKSVQRLLNIKLFDQIILVDDYSSDNSKHIANELKRLHKNIECVFQNKQQGKGSAVKAGLQEVKTKYVIVHDADLEYFPVDILDMYKIALNNPGALILGSRTLFGKSRNNKYKVTFLANKYFSKLFSIVNYYNVSDIASCYWIIESKILRDFDIEEKGFALEVEVLSKYLKIGSNIIETPINYEGRLYSEGKKIKLKDGIIIFIKILRYSKLNIFYRF